MAEAILTPAPRSILVINVCRIGDTLLATPALRALACAWPQAQITVLGHPKRFEVLEHLPWIAAAKGISKNSAPLRGRFLPSHYDLALVYGFDLPLVRYALRVAQRVIAFRQRDDALNRRLFRVVEVPAFQATHAVRQALLLPDAIGVPHAGYRLGYRVTDEETAWADRRLLAIEPGTRGPLIGLQASSFPTKAYRDWPAAQFVELACRLRAHRQGAHFLIFGGPADRDRTNWISQRLGAGSTVFAGELSLRQTAALMSRTQLYVGVDTGPTHMMGCFDIPLVGLYHCFSPSHLVGALEHPCFYAVDHPRAWRCAVETPMAEITVETVLAAVERALSEHPGVP